MAQGATTLSAGFTQPASGANVTISVGDTSWLIPTAIIYIQSGGYYSVQSIGGATAATIQNLGYSGNAAPGAAISISQPVGPAGIQGVTGSTGLGTMNSISPTTTKGDLIVDNGANSPSSGLVRRAVGSDGKALVADSTQATGINYATITPNSTATPSDTDNLIPIFDAPVGNEAPAATQKSKLLITDDGALQSTPTGGNARGSKAIDLQVERAAATQVASGARSGILSGRDNTASGTDSCVSGGDGNVASGESSFVGAGGYFASSGGGPNTASGQGSAVLAGASNTASGISSSILAGSGNLATATYASVSGGKGNTASGAASFVGGGQQNQATNTNSAALGGKSNQVTAENAATIGGQSALADKYGQVSHAGGQFAAAGDAQFSDLIFRNSTTNSTPTILYLDGGTTPSRGTIGNNSSWTFSGLIVARRDNGDTASWKFEGGIHNNAGTTALIGTITPVLIGADAGCAATWGLPANIAVTADNVNDCLTITVTGSVANNIRWVCHVRMVEVYY